MEFTIKIPKEQQKNIAKILDEWEKILRQDQEEKDLLRWNDEGPLPIKKGDEE